MQNQIILEHSKNYYKDKEYIWEWDNLEEDQLELKDLFDIMNNLIQYTYIYE